MLQSNGQLRTEKDGDTDKGCNNLLYSRILLTMIMIMMITVTKMMMKLYIVYTCIYF